MACVLKLMAVGTSALVVDRCGRRPLLLLGAMLTAAGLAVCRYALPPSQTRHPLHSHRPHPHHHPLCCPTATVHPVSPNDRAPPAGMRSIHRTRPRLCSSRVSTSSSPRTPCLSPPSSTRFCRSSSRPPHGPSLQESPPPLPLPPAPPPTPPSSPFVTPSATAASSPRTHACASSASPTPLPTSLGIPCLPPLVPRGRYACVCVVGGLAVCLLLPETRGKSLAEIQSLLIERQSCGGHVCGKGTPRPSVEAEPAGTAALAVALHAGGRLHSSSEASDDDTNESDLPPLNQRTSSAFVLAI